MILRWFHFSAQQDNTFLELFESLEKTIGLLIQDRSVDPKS